MKSLIIAEKPSLARNICAAITPTPKWVAGSAKNTGYYENNDYIVAYAFGHLLSLNDAEDYNEDWKQWSVDTLPIIPSEFLYKKGGDAGAKAQLTLLKKAIARQDVDKVVNAGDSDREGEIIIRNILNYAGCKKPVYRLWMPDQTPKTIKAELASMKPDSVYDNLAAEGYARTFIDWLYGINLTRLATKKAGTLLRVGRVTSPIVVAICERERAIRNFVPVKYYVGTHDENDLKLTSKIKHEKPSDAEDMCKRYNSLPTVVEDIVSSRKVFPRPKLFALSDLQGAAGRAFKFTPKKTLDVLQKLYEDGYCSYPRTNSRYMAEAEKQKASDIIDAIQTAMGVTGIAFRNTKEIFDDSKIESHSAITPTYKIPNLAALPTEQQQLYTMILNRFMAAFCVEDYAANRTEMVIGNGEESFKLTGDVIITKGYTVFEAVNKKEATLPNLKKGDSIQPCFKPVEKETTPPDHYNADSLNAYLKNPYSKDEKQNLSDEDEEAAEVISEVELGTEATRAGLIDGAIKSGYITLQKNKYGITSDGEYYVDSLARLGIDMTKHRTLSLSKSLKAVYKGQKSVDSVVQDAASDLQEIVSFGKKQTDAASATTKKGENGVEQKVFCKCPVCGKNIVETPKAWSCEDRGCGCVIFKDDKFFTRQKKNMNATLAKSLFTKGYADVEGLVSARTGKAYNARVKVSFDQTPRYPKYELSFDDFKKK
jgi:DNA topoisomerase-3